MHTPLPLSRRDVLRSAAVGGSTAALHLGGFAQPGGPARSDTGAEFITSDTQAAIDRGLGVLAQAQAADGSFGGSALGAIAGVTGLAGLALMAAGHQPGRGRYGKNVSRVVDAITTLPTAGTSGFLTAAANRLETQPSAMYSHGFASLFLAEVCGMVPDAARQKQVRATLERATAFAVAAQNKEGGWRYEPNAPYADVSVTVAFMMALRAARNAGVFVRKSVVQKGAKYIRDCQLADGGFSYVRGGQGLGGGSALARSAAAVVGLYTASIPEDEVENNKAIERGLRYVQQFVPNRQFNQRELPPAHYYYGQYYAALAMWTAGGDYWRTWFPAARDELLARAKNTGGTWTDHFHGTAYATAMSLIVLQLPNNYLPILQK